MSPEEIQLPHGHQTSSQLHNCNTEISPIKGKGFFSGPLDMLKGSPESKSRS